MPQRMLCTDCHRVAVADTVLSGSDLVELMAWSFLILPGWIYCWWRHINRIKACPSCGGQELMRESRASAARQRPYSPPLRIRNSTGPVRWPGPFRTPRTRLRSGTLGSVPPTVALVAWLFGMAGWAPIGTVVTAIGLALLASLAWLILQGIQLTRSQVVARCRAWDERGRALRIEPL